MSPGVSFSSELPSTSSPHRSLSPHAPSTGSISGTGGGVEDTGEEGSVTRDSIKGLFPKTVDTEELSWFPTLAGVYWDKNKDRMVLDSDVHRGIVVDGTVGVAAVAERYGEMEDERMEEKEKGGHLTRRCLESMKIDGKVERKIFRTLCEALDVK